MAKRQCMRMRIIGLLFAWVLVLAGCGSDADNAAVGEPTPLRIGTPMQVHQTNLLADYGYNILAMLVTHDTLVRFDPAMQPIPQLAASWQVSPDGLEWQFHLRPDARWHDGRPVTPSDVKFTFEYLGAHHEASAWIRDLIREIRIDGPTVTFALTKPHSFFLINGGFIIRILPQHIWQDIADPLKPEDAAVTVGCGPFIFDGFDGQGSRITFRRNDAYHGPAPTVERIEFLFNRTFDALTLSLLRGDIDLYYRYASGFSAPHLPRLAQAPHIQLPQADAMGVPAALGFNLKNSCVSLPAFRKAVVLALDYEKMAQSLLGTSGKIPTGGFLPPAFSYHLQMQPLTFNPEESRRMLDAAGFTDSDNDGVRNHPGGGNVSLTLLSRADLEGTDALLPIISHNLRQVGINMEVRKTDLSTWIAQLQQGQFDMTLFRTTPWGMLMEAGCGAGYFDSRRHGGGTLNNVDDPAFHALCDRILETVEPAARDRLYQDMQRYYADQLPAVALCWAVNTYPAIDRWEGMSVNQIEGGVVNRQTFSELRPAAGWGSR